MARDRIDIIREHIDAIITSIPLQKNPTSAMERERMELALELKQWQEKLEQYLENTDFIFGVKKNSQLIIGDNNTQNNEQ